MASVLIPLPDRDFDVTEVAVALESGEVTVTSDAPLDLDVVRAAVDEAGYVLTA